MSKMWPNKGTRNCASCSTSVPHGAGWSYRDDRGWHTVCRSAACARDLGLDTDETPASTTVTARLEGGRIVVQSPPPWELATNPLPLLRALPGARFDGASKTWSCSASGEDRPRVVELLDRLAAEFDASLRETPEDPRVTAALARADQIPTLRPYQRDGIAWLSGRTNALLGDDMGLGKTLQVLVSVPAQARVIVTCPKSLKFTWADEAARWRPDFTVSVLAGRGSFRAPTPGEIVVINYDIIPQPADIADLDLSDVILVVDEAVALKSFQRLPHNTIKGASRAKKIHAIGERCARRWLLTGTPLANRPPDLYGLLDAGGMAEEAFGHFGQFMRAFNAHKGRYGIEWGAPEPSVPEKLRRVMIQRKKSEVLKDLPTKQYQWLRVNNVSRQMAKQLDDLWRDFGGTLQRGELPAFEEMSQIRAKLAESRVQHAIELASQYEDAGKPLVVFSAHRAPVDAFLDREGWAVITGDTPAVQRADIVKRFQAHQLKGIALTIGAGSTGLTLTAADTVLFVDLAWRPTDNAQAEDRICRIGQTAQQCHVIRMVTDHVLDKHVCNLLAEKQALIECAVENTYDYTPTDPTTEAAPRFDEETAEQRLTRILEAQETEKKQTRAQHGELVECVMDREIARHHKRHGTMPQIALDDARRDAIRDAYAYMLSCCDGAVTEDFAGFNKPDATVAHKVAKFDLDDDQSLRALCLMLRRYPRQLRDDFEAIWVSAIDDSVHSR